MGESPGSDDTIVFVTEHFAPNDSTTAALLTDIARTLESSEHHLKVICTTPLDGAPEVELGDAEIVRISRPGWDKNRLVQRLGLMVLSTVKLSWKTLWSLRKGNHLFSVTNPVFLLLVFAALRRVRRCEYTLLVYDVFPENSLAAGMTSPKSPLYKVTRWVFGWAYRQADRLIVIGRDMEEVLAAKTKNKVAIEVIPNWCDTDAVVPTDRADNEMLIKMGLEDKIVFSFVGNLGRVQGVSNMLEAADRVDHPDFALLFVGDGAMKGEVTNYIDTHRDGVVYYGGTHPASDEHTFLNACDVAVVSLGDGMYGLGVPSKSYKNMGAGKPLLFIGDHDSEIGRLVREHDIGWIVAPDDPAELAAMFDKICVESRFDVKGAKARKTVVEHFDATSVLDRYRRLYD